ncbi:MAG: NifB/NifX family molybdenum-iron cluster-binding protein [Opitutales bacterium]|jgi:predicted Fe-Mo cluster-binding NifX family protein
MKLAITTSEPGANAALDSHFGRARYFRIIDTETGEQSEFDNASGVNATQGAGIQAAQALARLGVEVVITGSVGPKAMSALKAADIRIYSMSEGTSDQAAKAFSEGLLKELA